VTELILNIDGKVPVSRERQNINHSGKQRADFMLYRNVNGRPLGPSDFEVFNIDEANSTSSVVKEQLFGRLK